MSFRALMLRKEKDLPQSAQRTAAHIKSSLMIGCLRDFWGERILEPAGSCVFQLSRQPILEHR
jgi:hypothetical protein